MCAPGQGSRERKGVGVGGSHLIIPQFIYMIIAHCVCPSWFQCDSKCLLPVRRAIRIQGRSLSVTNLIFRHKAIIIFGHITTQKCTYEKWIPSLHWWWPELTRKTGGTFNNVSRALQSILSEFVYCRNRNPYANSKLKLCTCAQSHALGTRTYFQLEILTIDVICRIVYFTGLFRRARKTLVKQPQASTTIIFIYFLYNIPFQH